jgi:hypothetical protein
MDFVSPNQRPLPGDHGDTLAGLDGLSERNAIAVHEYGLEPTTLWQTDHYRAMREFCADPKGFVEAAILEVDLEEREGGV